MATTSPTDIDLARGRQSRELQDTRIAAGLVFLLLREGAWVHRRVENFSFVDDQSARRQMSVDFTLPLATSRPVSDLYRLIPAYVPLAMLNKQPLRRFSIWNEEGATLPVLSTVENGALAGSMLVGMGRAIAGRLGSDLPEEVATALRQIAILPAAPAQLLFRCLHLDPWQQYDLLGPAWAIDRRVLNALDPLAPHTNLVRELLNNGPLRVLAGELSQQFILFAQFAELSELRTRRVVKFVYDETLSLTKIPPDRPTLRALARRSGGIFLESLSWSATSFTFSGVPAGHAASHHVEIVAPPEMEIVLATLRAPGLNGRVHDDRAAPRAEVAHLQVSGVPRESRGTATVSLRAKRPGLLRSGPILGWLTAAMLLFTKNHLRHIDRGAGTVLLLAVPTLLAAFVARPGEHALATRSLIGVRLCVVGIGLCSAAVAIALATGISGHHHLRQIWAVAADAACGLAGVVTVSWLLPREA